jgi:phospholipid/cholesterol/gamma-HCH transport system substrate-binding protein
MAKQTVNNIKLGVFVLGGMLFLVILLYMIGKNRNLFGDTYILKARFENIQGLVAGNNVRFSGIQTGTVKRIKILSDTVIEITMIIETRMKKIIRKNAIVSIGTDGLVGNKVINIVPSRQPSALAEEGDILSSRKSVDTEEMLQTLSKTNNDVAIIASELKSTVQRISSSSALWDILNDKSIPQDLRMAVANIRKATARAGNMVDELFTIINDVKNGKGSAGVLLTDTAFSHNLNAAILKIKSVGDEADTLASEITKVVESIQHDLNKGKGTAHALLKDSLMAVKLNTSLESIQKGTEGFNQNMEALKHSIFFRGYFRKLDKKK